MTENTRPQNYTVDKTVSDSTMSDVLSGLGVPTRPVSGDPMHIGHIGQPRAGLKAALNVFSDMAITNAEATQSEQPPERSERIDLRALGAAQLPEAAATVEATIVGDVESTATIRLTLVETTWVVDVVLATGDLESVYDEAGPVPKPATVPDWLAATCSELGLEEVSV